ncbi:hypothetical protein A2634_05400 [Candidatus Amesbacteria bacterium RIFCSPHIGHO2_01_FULL_48_32]|uniref:Uncharacterized protein n=1 Tax=Candidatus Amesbacteria bacterium RIFCSPLOWO2_01_FULL_48_25 TaxID=1797259 RepID=A0A1F4ZCR4_9BACT|nr:MAG: hypothetical protein A2634_05400 [Candidatus Amesbacteria bacterium RIFCSPHIGHO2_01_FULL_48_32]OGD04102.1 MAG: hypothetical protein A2989_01750 [Candidatus Amesbacteria bacterium RIFCSPLOWO2_01_FULL_48_25]
MGWSLKLTKGQSLIEVLTAVGLTAVLLPALITGLVASREGRAQLAQRSEATELAREAAEALRVIREKGWINMAVTGPYHPVLDGTGNSWTLASGSQLINGFTRVMVISDAQRDANNDIVASGGTPDPSTKKVDITVSWGTPLASSILSTMYFTRLENLAYTETTEEQFLAGEPVGTTVTNDGGGAVTLAGGGGGDWCSPTNPVASKDFSGNGVPTDITAIEGQAFAGTGANASGVSFVNIDIPVDPTQTSIVGTFAQNPQLKTNDIFGETNYAYLATDNNQKEIVIIDLSTSPYSESGNFDSSGPSDANSVYVNGATGYMTAGSTFYTLDLSSHTGSRNQLGSVALSGTAGKMMVSGSYAYVTISGNSSRELEIINIDPPTSPSVVGWADVAGTDGRDVYINDSQTRAYLVTSASVTQPEFFIIDVTSKDGAQPLVSGGTYDTSGMDPKGVTLVTGNKAIIVGHDAEEYQVINISTESSPVYCGGRGSDPLHGLDSGVNGVASIVDSRNGKAYSYIVTGDSGAELKIIEGGPGGGYATSGTFESAIFDAAALGYSQITAFNRYIANAILPSDTTISYQFAVGDAVSGSCTGVTYIYVDPNPDGSIPLDDDGSGYENPGQCFRYKAILNTTGSGATPVFEDITIYFSP